MELPEESERSREIPIEILQDILLRLPTRDVARSSCVSKLWRSIIGDTSFRKLHDADHVAARSESEALLVSEIREPGRPDVASIFSLSSRKAMCHIVIPSGYMLTNVCNGFLCFAVDHSQALAIVCNPATGEMLKLPEAPPISGTKDRVTLSHLFVLGFSPATREYKVFRLSFPCSSYYEEIHIAVYTLGGSGGWRQYSYLSRFRPIFSSPPVYIDGNLYVLITDDLRREHAARMLVFNVAKETGYTYRAPYYYHYYNWQWTEMLADGFELNGEMCLAVNIFDPHHRRKIQFWVMTPPGEHEDKDYDKLYWDLRYCFYPGESYYFNQQRSAWIDHNQMLCYRHGQSLYKHDMKGYLLSSPKVGAYVLFDRKLQLPQAGPSPAPAASSQFIALQSCRWNICGGYRPSLLSPLTFALSPSQEEKGKKTRQFEHNLLDVLAQI
ncbi:unnamed protein product [Urochloa humidicola]